MTHSTTCPLCGACYEESSEDCRQDRTLNAEMKRLWNEQPPNA